MNRINVLFKMIIASLVLVFYRSFYVFKTGIVSFYDLFGYPNYTLDLIISYILRIISVVGSLLLFGTLILFFIESIKLLREK